MKKLLAVLFAVLMCFSFTACGEKNELIGTWHTYDLGVDIDSPEIPPYYSIVFANDGTGRGPMSGLDRLDTVVFDYTIEGDLINVVTDEGKEIAIKYWFEKYKTQAE